MTKNKVISKLPQAIAIVGLVTVALFIAPRSYGQDQQPTAKPNVLFIFADDWGWGDLSLHDSPIVRTPNLVEGKGSRTQNRRRLETSPRTFSFPYLFFDEVGLHGTGDLPKFHRLQWQPSMQVQ